jgi:hypothetical protein
MSEMIVKILVQLISTLAVATKQIKQGRLSESDLTDMSLGLDSMRRREVRKEAFRRK